MKCPACQAENPADQSYCGACGARLPAVAPQDEFSPTTSAREPGEPTTGTTLADRYQIIEELGHGGMGRVYKVFDTQVKERIALKLLKPELAADRDTIERFSRELKLARRITHRNVCRLYDLGRSGTTTYLTMEYVEGEDLRRLMRKVGVFGAGQMVRIARQLCDGLAEAHRLGIVHRDLKPQNVMVDDDGNAKIMDFGIARLVRGKAITGAGVIIGTPQYMSPEQVEGQEADPRSDIYSLGVILFEMATGRVPFDGDQPLAVAHKQKYEAPTDPRTLNAQLTPALGGLILKCLAKDKAARCQSADEVRAELDKVALGLPTTEQVVAKRHTTSTQLTIPLGPRPLLAAAAVLIVVLAGLFAWRLWLPKVPVSPKTGKPTIAVTWFDNQSDRADLDRVLVSLLTTNLSRDEALEVISTQRMFDILKQIGKADAKTIDRSIATDVATRAGAGTMVTGSVIKLGEQVRITAELVNVANGGIVATLKEDGKRIDDVIPMVDRLTEQIRQRLGVSQAAQALKVADVSTASLEAYEHFQKGQDFLQRWSFSSAEKELEQAVAIDSTFAGAWVALAQARVGFAYVFDPFADVSSGTTAITEARKHVARATERERLGIELVQATLERDSARVLAHAEDLVARFPDDRWGNLFLIFARGAEGDAKGATAAAERYLELNPTDANTYNELAYSQARVGDFAAAISSVKKYVSLHPDVANALDSAWEIHVWAGLFDEALAYADKYRQLRPKSANPGHYRVITFLMRDEPARARQEIAADAVLSPLSKTTYLGASYLVEGRYREAEAAFREAVAAAEDALRKAGPAAVAGIGDLRDAHFGVGQMLTVEGRTREAIREFEAGEEISAKEATTRVDPYAVLSRYLMGAAEVRSGNYTVALAKADEIRELVRRHGLTAPLLDYREFLLAEVAAARRDAQVLGAALDRVSGVHRQTSPIYWRLAAVRSTLRGDIESAERVYEAFRPRIELTRYGQGKPFIFFHVRSRLGYTLGRLYKQQGDTAKAREQYSRFLTLMNRADAGLTEVEDAKKRLAALGGR